MATVSEKWDASAPCISIDSKRDQPGAQYSSGSCIIPNVLKILGNHMTGFRRGLAFVACNLIDKALPSSLQLWGHAIRAETADIEDDTEALLFALDSLFTFIRRATIFQLLRLSSAIAGPEKCTSEGPASMMYLDQWQATPRAVGALCAVGATFLGLAFMTMGGAPTAYLSVNFGALVIGFLLFANLNHSRFTSDRWRGLMMLAAGLSLAATALFGLQADGNTRWIKLGPFALQPSLILLPMMIVAFVRLRSWTATFGMIAAAFALALQPDRAMSAALAAAMLALLLSRRDQLTILAAITSIVGFTVTLLRPDAGQAVPFVDQIIFESFDVHVLAGMAVVGGLALLLLPALAGLRFGGAVREASLVFGVTWASVIVAAALGNYPTPLVGYSGGAVLGYVLSLSMLPKANAARELKGAVSDRDDVKALGSDVSLMLGSG